MAGLGADHSASQEQGMRAFVRVVAVGVFFGQVSTTLSATAGVRLIGPAQIAGDAAERSGLTNLLEGGIPHNRLGGISAIEFTGQDDRYLLLADRGPADGALPYRCRWHTIKLAVQPARTPAVTVELLATTLLQTESGAGLVGDAGAINAHDVSQSLRFDP